VLAEADVVASGGGTAGISAACGAARHGANVILLELWLSIGGMATSALVNIWHTSDRTKQVIHCILQEGRWNAADGSWAGRRVSSTLRHPAWEFTDFLALSFGRVEPAY
jgi:NADPH-dependent 2,4-dienoyl-CoA reductase/sulfur reductase-like enzyme